jgi:hypothetical protein
MARLSRNPARTTRPKVPRRETSGSRTPSGTNTTTFCSMSRASVSCSGTRSRNTVHGRSAPVLPSSIGKTVLASTPAPYPHTTAATTARGVVSAPRRCNHHTRTAKATTASGTTTGSAVIWRASLGMRRSSPGGHTTRRRHAGRRRAGHAEPHGQHLTKRTGPSRPHQAHRHARVSPTVSSNTDAHRRRH